jgi:four helix bundle protein
MAFPGLRVNTCSMELPWLNLVGYRKLRVWQCGIELCKRAYGATTQFPDSERFGLTSQMRRAAVSIPSNIGEGSARRSTKELLYFTSVACGSCEELQTLIVVAFNAGYLDELEAVSLFEEAEEIGRMLNGMRASLERKGRT